MKKFFSVIALSVAVVASANAQSLLGNLLSGVTGGNSSAASTVTSVIEGLAGTVYSAPVSLNGAYTYNGIAISATSSKGDVLANVAGSAVTSGLESKADEYLAKIGIKPGVLTFTFNAADNSFVMNCGPVSLPGTYKVGDGERTVTLTFGKTMQFLCMTGTLESSLSGAKLLFTADKMMDFLKKLAKQLGESSSQLKSISSLAEGYDTFRIGMKLAK